MSKKQKYWLFGALFISLAVNLFVLGAFGYGTYQFKELQNQDWVEKRLNSGEKFFLKQLDGADREHAKDIFKLHRTELRNAMNDLRGARRDFADAMRADTPQTELLVSILDRSQIAAGEINVAFHSTLRDLATRLSPEARRKISLHMRRHHHRKHDDRDNDAHND